MYENVNKDCRYLVVFLISCNKNSFFVISMFWINFYRIAYIAKLSFSLTTSPSFPGSARAESNTEESLLIFYILNESISELKVNR